MEKTTEGYTAGNLKAREAQFTSIMGRNRLMRVEIQLIITVITIF